MGADRGVGVMVDGAVEAATTLGKKARITMVGRQELIEAELKRITDRPANLSVTHAETEVPMHIAATDGVRMRDSSVSVGLKLVKEGKADAFVSPGNTGAVMATALLTLGRIEGVSRPAIVALFPTQTGTPTVVLDVGANADSKPQHLSQFAVMGSVYVSTMYGVEAPRVGIISIGEERSKGNELIFNAQKLLKDSTINFVGNIEGRDILSGTIDVGVTDGFTGNIMLKFAESIQPMLVRSVQRQIQTNIFSRMGVMLLLPFLKRMRNTFDYAESGGAPLLGVDGTVIICHGSSNARAIRNACAVAYRMAARGIKDKIHDELITNHFGQANGAKSKSEDNRDGVVCASRSTD
jgi:glycerol-3-phosphate acyltransferase PlsX